MACSCSPISAKRSALTTKTRISQNALPESRVWTFVSYGRSPATEVVIDTDAVSAVTALEGVSSAVARTERTGACS